MPDELKIDAAVTAADEPSLAVARSLAEEIGLPLIGLPAPQVRLLLVAGASGLVLEAREDPGAPLSLDFTAGEMRHRRLYGANRSSLLAKAVGAKRVHDAPSVIDATAGLGRDAFVLALLGCRVRMLERSPVLWALLRDAVSRASRDAEVCEVVARMTLLRGDARDQLPALAGPGDVVYVDPMFPGERRSALVKREMRLCRAAAGDDLDADELLAAALRSPARRIVVKRMRSAPPLLGMKPALRMDGKTNRFDIYLRAS